MPKGIVLEIQGNEVIVLTPQGTFERAKRPDGVELGQEILFSTKKKSLATWNKWASFAACLCLAAGLWSYWNISNRNSVYAYVELDINPSIELGINQAGHVITAAGLNSDGQQLLGKLSVKGESVQQAVAEITSCAAKTGYVVQNSEIVITTTSSGRNGHQGEGSNPQGGTTTDSGKSSDLKKIQQAVVESAQDTIRNIVPNVSVEGIEVSQKFFDAARSEGISPAKYAFYLKAQQLGYPVTIDELKKFSRTEVSIKYGIPDSLLNGETTASLDADLQNDTSDKTGSNHTISSGHSNDSTNSHSDDSASSNAISHHDRNSGSNHTDGRNQEDSSSSNQPAAFSVHPSKNEHLNSQKSGTGNPHVDSNKHKENDNQDDDKTKQDDHSSNKSKRDSSEKNQKQDGKPNEELKQQKKDQQEHKGISAYSFFTNDVLF